MAGVGVQGTELTAAGPMLDRVVVVTGASRGIGYSAARALARAGARVVALSRDAERTKAAADRIERATGSQVDVVVADFSEFEQVRRAAADILSRYERIDVLVNNAGAIYERRTLTVDGFETTLQVDHMAPFLLTRLLQPGLAVGAPSRVVTVSSDAHLFAYRGFDFDDPGLENGWGPLRAYAQAKLANIMFATELARRWAPLSVTSNSVHPGTVRTGFAETDWSHTPAWRRLALVGMALSADEGADTVVYLASSPDVEGATGLYYHKRRPKLPSHWARDAETQRRLWDWTSEAVGLPSDVEQPLEAATR